MQNWDFFSFPFFFFKQYNQSVLQLAGPETEYLTVTWPPQL